MKKYTLQDAKEEYAQRNGFKDWQTILHALDSYSIIDAKDAIAKLYASKVTEELRKENEALKESNKELVEALQKLEPQLEAHGFKLVAKDIRDLIQKSI